MTDFDNKKFHFVFTTTCTITGKSFVDYHSTDDLDDGYLGRSQILEESIKTHGVEAHVRTVIAHAHDRESVEDLGAQYKKTARMLATKPFAERTSRSPAKIETTNWARWTSK